MARSIVVTGAAGFIGSWTVKALLERGWSVTAFDRTTDDRLLRRVAGGDAADRVVRRAGDIADPETVDALFEEAAPEAAIHLAAVLIPACRDDPATGARIDVLGHVNAFEAAARAGCRHVVYASSAAAAARRPDGSLDTVYGAFKLWGEEFAAVRLRDRGLSSVGLRPAIVYGPGRESGATAFVNRAIEAAVAGRPHTLPARWRHRLEYVEEVADAFARCAGAAVAGAHVSDVTTEATGPEDLVAAIEAAVPGSVVRAPAGDDRPTPAAADDGPLAALVGERRRVSLEDGVARTVAHLRAWRESL